VQKIKYPKEQMHRIRYTKLTEQQIAEKLAPAAAGPTCASPCSEALAGKSLRIVIDEGPVLSYAFKSKNKLTLAEDTGARVDAGYGALALKQIVLFSHLVPKTQRGYHVIVDLTSNLATVFEVWFSGYTDKREVQRQIHYGFVDVKGHELNHTWLTLAVPGAPRPVFTKIEHHKKALGDVLVGRIARQLRVRKPFFDEMIRCTKSREQYIRQVRDDPFPPWDQ